MEAAQKNNLLRWQVYEQLAEINYGGGQEPTGK